jgi:hypothetical protein
MRIATVSYAIQMIKGLALIAVAAVSWTCARGDSNRPGELLYVHGRIHVDARTAARWDANEREIAAEGERIKPIPADDKTPSVVPFSGNAVATLSALRPSERHGAVDKRILSVLGKDRARSDLVVSSGIIAQVALVKGSEYKSEAHFRKGWLPIAIIVVADSAPADSIIYPKLKLRGGTSWLYVREESQSKWDASLVRIVNGKVAQDSLDVSVASDDVVEPVIGARFKWENDDESVWAYCGGKCCRVIASIK